MNRAPLVVTVALIASLAALAEPQAATDSAPTTPHAKVVGLDVKGKRELPILTGAPDSYRMRSGLVVLTPGDSAGQHSTKNNEELLIVLEGSGEMVFGDGSRLALHGGSALYCSPETTHNVINTGTATLRYVYIVSQAK